MYILDHSDEYLDGKLLNKLGAIQKNKEKEIFLKYPLFSRSDDKSAAICMQEKFATILKRCAVERVVLLEVHSKAALNIYHEIFGENNVRNISAADIFAEYIANLISDSGAAVAVGAPDGGDKKDDMAVDRVKQLQNCLSKRHIDTEIFYICKKRENEIVEIVGFEGDVEGKICILFDDLIDSGSSMIKAVQALKSRGASSVYAFATHACFSKAAFERLLQCKEIDQILVTDVIRKNFKVQNHFRKKFKILPCDVRSLMED